MKPDLELSLSQGSIAELGAHFRRRRLSVGEAVGWYLSRIDAINQSGPAINAVREVSARALDDAQNADRELATGRDKGPLHGIPVLLKDNILTSDGMVASAGAAALAGFRPRREALLVRRLRQSGAIILGKTNLCEFADYVSDVMPSGFSGAGGMVRNPHGNDAPCGIGSLKELIAWNEEHPDAIPYGQSLLIAADLTNGLDDPAYRADRQQDITLSRNSGIDAALAMNDVHALIAPMGAAAKCTGKAGAPVVAIPVGLDSTGRPFGVSVFASAGGDAPLLAIATAIETAIGVRQIPGI